VEKLPEAAADGSTNVYGLYVAGDLRGIPLLKFAADSGARVVRTIAEDSGRPPAEDGVADLAIVGGGVAGLSAALEASGLGLTYRWFEASEPFSTIVNFPKGKPIYTYPKDMVPEGSLRLSADVKEDLVDELRRQKESAGVRIEAGRVERVVKRGAVFDVEVAGQTEPARAAKVVVAIGRSGDIRRLGVPGEDLDKVYNRLHDPADFCGANTLVVGGGDTALETAIALANCGAGVTLCCRSDRLSRPKEENLEALEGLAENGAGRAEVRSPSSGRVTTASGDYLGGGLRRESVSLVLETQVKEIRPDEVVLAGDDGEERTIPNDVVFTMIGRDPPLDFFRRAGVAIRGEWTWRKAAGLAAFLLFAALLYNWKSGGQLGDLFYHNNWWPVSIASSLDADARPPGSLVGVVARSASTPSFWYTLAYSVLVVVFGLRRIRRRDMPYVTVQTWVLMAIQVLPLFVLPEILLPWLGNNGWLPQGFLDSLFPAADYGNGREYWRAYGLILAWPLNVYNVFTGQPLGWWLAISFVQTFVLIPAAIFFWGKGAYCGWVCSCGALAETLGDGQRHKMPHGPGWNRLNAAGQVLLAVATALLIVRVLSWALPGTGLADLSNTLLYNKIFGYKWVVDVFLAGVVGYGVYFWLSGRVWCRFFCPLAALMHIYARFSRFRILADKKKCISCNVCTSVCHMGIDVMNFANKGLPMRDPECVRCSACVYECPTGVLQFGRVDGDGRPAAVDNLPASPVRAREG
jgi:thioredoxin reductase/ferredoxin